MGQPKMRALVLHENGGLRVDVIRRPSPGDGEVLIRVAACGVCGSDFPRIFGGKAYHYPLICGHEFSGIIESVGAGVTGLCPGERVVGFPLIWCGRCPPCGRGRYALCENYDYRGSRSDGGFAEFVTLPRENVLPVPEDVSHEEAAMTEPAAVALHGVLRGGPPAEGDAVAVFGAGPVGLMAAQWARIMGADPIFIFDIVQEKLVLSGRVGFTQGYSSGQVDPLDVIHRWTEGRGVTVCIEAAGAPSALIQAVQVIGRDGQVVVLGNPSADVRLSPSVLSSFMRREATIRGTWNSNFTPSGAESDWRRVLREAGKRLQLTPLISHRITLDEAPGLFADLWEGKGFYSKIMLFPAGVRPSGG